MRIARRRFAAVCIIAVIAVVLLAACGSRSNKGAATPTETNAPAELPTIADPLRPALTPAQGTKVKYHLDVPVGWRPDTDPLGNDLYVFEEGGRRLAGITVYCDATYKDLDAAADGLVSLLGTKNTVTSNANLAKAQTSVNGRPGWLVSWTTDVAGITLVQEAALVGGDACVWNIHLTLFASGNASDYRKLFGRVLDTFTPPS